MDFGYQRKSFITLFSFGSFTKNADSILLDREASNMSSFFSDTKKVVQKGHSIFIFPEGTRNKTNNQISSFKEGAKLIALKNRIDILPVFIKTNANAILKEAIEKRTKNLEIEIEIGDLIDYKDKTSLETLYKNQFNIK